MARTPRTPVTPLEIRVAYKQTKVILCWPTCANFRPKTLHTTPTLQPHLCTFRNVVVLWLWPHQSHTTPTPQPHLATFFVVTANIGVTLTADWQQLLSLVVQMTHGSEWDMEIWRTRGLKMSHEGARPTNDCVSYSVCFVIWPTTIILNYKWLCGETWMSIVCHLKCTQS